MHGLLEISVSFHFKSVNEFLEFYVFFVMIMQNEIQE